MRTIGYAYPWDVLTPGFVERTAELGVDAVSVALNYHSARCATPWSASGSAVHARTSALYRPVDPDAWPDLRPASAEWMSEPDPGAAAVAVLQDAGIPALGWIVLTHNTFVGQAHPELTMRNCFGEEYPWALCPNNARVQAFCAQLTAAAVDGLNLAGVVLESWGQMGAVHQCEHEKTAGVWNADAVRLLSVCCCDSCATRWGLPAQHVITALAGAARQAIAGQPATLPGELAELLLHVRQTGADELRRGVINVLDPGTRVTVHASADPWATGALPGLTPATAAEVNSIVLPYWLPTEAALQAIAMTADALPDGVRTGAYVTVAAAQPRPEIAEDVRQLSDAGVGELHLYHLGLAGPTRWPQLAAAANTTTELG